MMEEPHSKKIPTPPSSRPSSLRRPRTRYVSKIKITESTTETNEKEINLQKYKILPAIASCSDLRNERAKSNHIKSERQSGQDNRPKNNSERPVHPDSRSGSNSERLIDRDSTSSKRPVKKSGGSQGKSDSGKLNGDVLDNECNQISTNLEDISTRPESQCSVDENKVEIAIRLPDGGRHEVCCSSSGTFMDLLQNLASSSVSDTIIPMTKCEIVTSDVPQQVISDFNVTLREAKIKTRTLLYLREVDPD